VDRYPVQENQLKLNFGEVNHDDTADKALPGIPLLESAQKCLPKPEISSLQSVWVSRDNMVRRVANFRKISARNGPDAIKLQWPGNAGRRKKDILQIELQMGKNS
jgi:hypothetical protein